MARGFERPPAWAWAVMVLGAVWLGLGLFLSADQAPASGGYVDPSKAAEPTEEPITMAALGDSYTAGVGAMTPGQGYAPLTAQAMGASLEVFAEGGTGYTTTGGGQTRYVDRVEAVIAAAPDIVLIQGSTNDYRASGDEIRAAALDVFNRLLAGLPDAHFFALGAFDTPSSVSGLVDESQAAVSSAAAEVGVTYIDPTDWLDPENPAMFVDGFHPSQAGHQIIADHLAAVLGTVG